MATIKINNVTAISESGGTVSLNSAVANIPAAGITGVLPVGVTGGSGLTALTATKQRVYTVTFDGDTGNQSNGYNFGSALTIASGDNPNGAKFLIISGNGRVLATRVATPTRYLEGGATWTSSNGAVTTEITTTAHSTAIGEWLANGMNYCTYTNGSGSATQVDFKMYLKSSGTARWYADDTETVGGIIAIRMY